MSAPASVARRRGAADPSLRLVAAQPPRIADVALFYGERSGGIRTYLDAKAAYAQRSGAFEHHLVVPGRARSRDGARHELRSPTGRGTSGSWSAPVGAATGCARSRATFPNTSRTCSSTSPT